jgi:Uma2 family endonuclease
MPSSGERMATYEDLLALPEGTRGEVIAGQLNTAPSALPKHSRAVRALGSIIGKPYDDDDGRGGPGGWWILVEVDVRLAVHDIVRPDIAGWRRARLPDPWDNRPIDVTPDWICEVTSPSNVAYDRVIKAKLYAEHGVPYFWLVDPSERILECFELSGGIWLRTGSYDDSATVRIKPFDAIELEVAGLFPPKS